MSLYLDLSALQSVPAANLNRDDLGSPKQVQYGGASRIRVSSQSWKRVIRQGVERDLGERAARSRLVPAKVRHALEQAGWPSELAAFAGAQVAASAGKRGIGTEAAGHTSVLLFVPEAAVDDWLGEAETGSGHLDTAEFSSGVFYRYATVNVADLVKNLEGDQKAARTVLASFAEHFLMSLPQAKKNSTAPHTLPDLAYLAVREHRPLSLAAAFEAPVTADTTGGYAKPSRTALASYAANIHRLTGDRHRPFHGHATIAPDEKLSGIGDAHDSFVSLIDAAVTAALPETGEPQ